MAEDLDRELRVELRRAPAELAQSDDIAVPSDRPPATGIWEHYCQHPDCKLWGGYGYARSKGEYDWFCYEHRPEALQASGNPPSAF